jgi:hypothetical protein
MFTRRQRTVDRSLRSARERKLALRAFLGIRSCVKRGSDRSERGPGPQHQASGASRLDLAAGYETTFADLLEDAVTVMRQPSTHRPLIVVVVDELAARSATVNNEGSNTSHQLSSRQSHWGLDPAAAPPERARPVSIRV